MKTKNKSVNILQLASIFKTAIPVIEMACKKVQGESYEITITSGKDGKHMKNSLHYVGLAIDIRSRDMKIGTITNTCLSIQKTLGSDFDVVKELDHIHIEFDKKH